MGRPGIAEWRIVADWAPVLLVAAVAQTAIGSEEPWSGSDAALAISSLLLALPLALRRARPLSAAVLLAAALPIQVALGGSLHFGSFLAVLLAAFSTGRYVASWPRAAIGAVALLAGAFFATSAGLMANREEMVFPTFYVGAATVLGRVVRHLSHQAERLQQLNQALARERDAASRLAVASERIRLARDLHDVVAHVLMVMVVQAEAGEESLDRDPAAARRALRRIQAAGRDGLHELRGMVRVLRTDGEPGAAPSLDDLETLAMVLGEAGLAVTVTRGDGRSAATGRPAIPAQLSTDLFRVAQEALTNVVKHSAATSAEVRVETDRGGVSLLVRDPGPPLTGAGSPGGHGILGMTERLAGVGGTVHAGPCDGGFAVWATVPGTDGPAAGGDVRGKDRGRSGEELPG